MTNPSDREVDTSAPGTPTAGTADAAVADAPGTDEQTDQRTHVHDESTSSRLGAAGRFAREMVVIVVIALVASALLRAFVIQAFFVPSGSMLPEIKLNDRILVSRIGDVQRGEVVVFEDPGGWIPSTEQAPPPGTVRKAFEFIGVLPASGHEHLVKRAIGLPGDHVVCCDDQGKLTINGVAVDESDFLRQNGQGADNIDFNVTVPKDSIFVLGDNRYVSGDSSRHLSAQDAFIPMDLVTGRAFAVVWPSGDAHVLHVPDAYDDVPAGDTPPDKGVIKSPPPGGR
ncbi:MAG: signal peptidase I [Nocardioidaceae bacterium]|nr:signal peptidase I [Nocardioidaceae bacterium]